MSAFNRPGVLVVLLMDMQIKQKLISLKTEAPFAQMRGFAAVFVLLTVNLIKKKKIVLSTLGLTKQAT